jgi:hypothetical protein
MRIFIVIITVFICSCNSKKRELVIDNKIKAVGYINSDSSFDNLISFFDLNTNKLLYTANYKNKVLEGEKRDYYANGKIKSIQSFSNGTLNGFTYFYDSLGYLFSQQYTYYGVKAGHHIDFKYQKPIEYGFYSLDNDLLFYLNYDSLIGKKIDDFEASYFFYKERPLARDFFSRQNQNREFFIYLPQPPKFSFEYSVVTIDSSYKIKSVEKLLNKNTIWDLFILDENQNNSAIRLIIIDSLNGNSRYTMFKKL